MPRFVIATRFKRHPPTPRADTSIRFSKEYNDCQKFFPLLHRPQESKSPYPPFFKGGNLAEFLCKSPFEKGGFREI